MKKIIDKSELKIGNTYATNRPNQRVHTEEIGYYTVFRLQEINHIRGHYIGLILLSSYHSINADVQYFSSTIERDIKEGNLYDLND